jgi:hypothetical protein
MLKEITVLYKEALKMGEMTAEAIEQNWRYSRKEYLSEETQSAIIELWKNNRVALVINKK